MTAPDYFQAAVTLIGLVVGLALFLTLERYVVPRYDFTTQLDAAIPFLPWFWAVYAFFFPFVVILMAYASRERFKEYMLAVNLCFGIALFCYVLFPETMQRPAVDLIENDFLRHRFAHMWMVDLAANGFPSMHVVVTCLACRAIGPARYRKGAIAMGILIILSTLTVKQHTLVDVATGVALAFMVSALIARLRKPAQACSSQLGDENETLCGA